MSYRLIDSNAIAIKYPEVNELPCVFADLPDGMNGQFIVEQSESNIARDIATIIENEKDMRVILLGAKRKGKWIRTGEDGYCSECKCDMPIFREDWEFKFCETNYCPNCGADMRGVDNAPLADDDSIYG